MVVLNTSTCMYMFTCTCTYILHQKCAASNSIAYVTSLSWYVYYTYHLHYVCLSVCLLACLLACLPVCLSICLYHDGDVFQICEVREATRTEKKKRAMEMRAKELGALGFQV